jgi:hypothetical protein
MGILELPPTALVIALVTLQPCNARYHRGGPVYWSADMPKCLNMYNTVHTLSPSPPKATFIFIGLASSTRWGVA